MCFITHQSKRSYDEDQNKQGNGLRMCSIKSNNLKESAELLWHPFSELFINIPDNSSIYQQWKLGEVPPVFKTDCCLTKSHYKPLTILPSSSKVLEALVHSRISPSLHPSIHPSIHSVTDKGKIIKKLT